MCSTVMLLTHATVEVHWLFFCPLNGDGLVQYSIPFAQEAILRLLESAFVTNKPFP